MPRGSDWSAAEVEAIVADYMDMYAADLRGESFSKSEHNRRLREVLDGRSHGSVEFKHQNISAALAELDLPYLSGYVPRFNRQQLLFQSVDARLARDSGLMELIRRSAEAVIEQPAPPLALPTFEAPPVSSWQAASSCEPRPRSFRPPVNYIEREARNASLGRAGEELVLRIEKERLLQAGREDLVRDIRHVSITEGDGAGFDIESFDVDGRPRFIEVKTTGYAKSTPFFVTRNEVAVSNERAADYHLYRVFSMRRSPGLFALRGALDATCRLIPEVYSGRVA